MFAVRVEQTRLAPNKGSPDSVNMESVGAHQRDVAQTPAMSKRLASRAFVNAIAFGPFCAYCARGCGISRTPIEAVAFYPHHCVGVMDWMDLHAWHDG